MNDDERRVYADALLDGGEPLGEFIHLQLDLATRTFPRADAIARRKRERELWAAHHERWVAPLAGLATYPVFRRGFVEEANVDARVFAERGDEVFAAAPLLRYVLLSGLSDVDTTTSDPEAAVLARFARALASPAATRLGGLGYTIGVDISRDETGPYEYEDLGARALPILVAAAPRLTRLRELAPGSAYAESLVASGLLAQIDVLDLAEWDDAEAFAVLDALAPGQLRELTLPHLEITDAARVLAHPAITRLEQLSLSLRATRSSDADALLQAPTLAHLRKLYLSSPRQAGPIRSLARSPVLANLVELDLGETGPDEYRDAMPTAQLPSLRILRVGGGFTSEAVLRRIVEWPLVAQLEVLDLRPAYAATKIAGELAARFDGVLLTRAGLA